MAVRKVNEISSQMRAILNLSEPDLDTTIGTPVRKILDAVAEVVAEAYVDTHLLDYQYDIDAKTGADLDDFVKLFGFSRFPAKRATGTVVFERQTAADSVINIPINTQLTTEGASQVVVQTTTPALLMPGDTSIQVPAQAVLGGAQGNIAANALRRRLTPIEGINSFTNIAAFTGGADQESDEQLRSRFKRTIFRSMAGTEQMFLGIALDDPSVTHANVIGATKTFRESVETVAGQATSTIQDAAYIYPDSQIVGADIDNGDILSDGVHYTFDHSVIPPTLESIDGSAMADGIYDLIFEYVPLASRNDPSAGITNRIDVYVNGDRATEASEVVAFRSSRVFYSDESESESSTPAEGTLLVDNFVRADGSTPQPGNYFVAFAFSPVTDPSVNDEIIIGGDTYLEGTHYFLVNDVTNLGGTPTSLSGMEIVSAANGSGFTDPVDATLFQVNYIFNAVPRDIELAVRAWRLLTTDARVHQAHPIRLKLHMAVILEQGYPLAAVRDGVEEELSRYVSGVGFNGVVQVSDLMEVASRVSGVDAVRFLNSTDSADYAIQRVNAAGAVIETYQLGGRATDVLIGDDEYPVFNELVLVQKAQNSWGTV